MCADTWDAHKMQQILSTLISHNQKITYTYNTQNCNWIFHLFKLTALLLLKLFNLTFFPRLPMKYDGRLILSLELYWTLQESMLRILLYQLCFQMNNHICR